MVTCFGPLEEIKVYDAWTNPRISFGRIVFDFRCSENNKEGPLVLGVKRKKQYVAIEKTTGLVLDEHRPLRRVRAEDSLQKQ